MFVLEVHFPNTKSSCELCSISIHSSSSSFLFIVHMWKFIHYSCFLLWNTFLPTGGFLLMLIYFGHAVEHTAL